MLRVTIELFPYGDETGKKVLETFDIANDGTGTNELGNYVARFDGNLKWSETSVKDYPRRGHPVRKLVYLVLKHLYENN